MRVITAQGTNSELSDASLAEFRSAIRGNVALPGDDGYEAARKIFNAMIDKRPAFAVRCASAEDVISAVKFARSHALLLAVRSGGHSVGGKSVCDGGMLIDLSLMKGMHVDPERQACRAEAGLRLGEFDQETQAFGLATTLGVVTNTGIAGLTLGGGIGWLNGKYGLACDNLLSADVVTADGRFVTASADENEDLFWGLRGGGGNFGIVTSFEYQLHSVGPVLGGMVLYPMSKAEEALRFYGEFSRASPDELSTMALLVTTPDGSHMVAIAACYAGALEDGEKVLKPLRAFGPPAADLIKPMKYVEMQSLFDQSFPPGCLHYWKASFLSSLSDDAIETLVKYAQSKPSALSAIALQHMHGAATRVGPTETAFAHRHDQYDCLMLSMWTNPADSEKNLDWSRQSWDAMQPFLERSVYVNNLGEEGEDRVRDAYGPNFERLVALKNKYDSTNFFRLNQNIRPAV